MYCASLCCFLGLRVLLLLGLGFAPARPIPQSKKEALGKATSAWGGGGSLGKGALRLLALPCVVFLGVRVLLLLGLRFSPPHPAPDATIKKGSPREGYFCVGRWGGWGCGSLGRGGVASSCASLCCVLGLRVRLPLGLRFAPRAPDTAIKK